MNHTTASLLWALTLTLLGAAACEDDVTSSQPAAPIQGAAAPLPARANARMKVDQLRDSIAVVAGADAAGNAIGWSYHTPAGRTDLFTLLGPTLGQPDYINTTEEPAVTDAMYLKFSSDIALNVCAQMATADSSAGTGPRTLSRFASLDGSASDADIAANLRYLNLRFLGERIASDDTLTLNSLRAVYDAATAADTTTSAAASGWRAVCVALLQAPAFHIY